MANTQYNTQKRNNNTNDDEIRFDLLEHIGVIGTRKDSGWTREANIVAWNGGAAKVDIRDWDPDHERMSRGITLYESEAEDLAKVLCKRYGLEIVSGDDATEEKSGEDSGGLA